MMTRRDASHFWAGQFLVLTAWNFLSLLATRREWKKGSWFRKQGIP